MKGITCLALVLIGVIHATPQTLDPEMIALGFTPSRDSILRTTQVPTTRTQVPTTIDPNASNKDFVLYLLDVIAESVDTVRSSLKSDDTTTRPPTTTMSTTIEYPQQYCFYYYVQPDYLDNTSYYMCVNYTLLHKRCPSGGVFDYNALTCGGKCINGMTNSRSDPKPLYDSKYLQCVNSTWVEKSCPKSKYYYQYNYGEICTQIYCYDGFKQADPLDRTKYLECVVNTSTWVQKSCGAGKTYDRYLSQCVNSKCKDGDTTGIYHFWDALYMECGTLKSCPHEDKFWPSLSQCVGSKGDLITTTTTTNRPPTTTHRPAIASTDRPPTTSINRPTTISTKSPSIVLTLPTISTTVSNATCTLKTPYYYFGYYQYNPYFKCEKGNWVIKNCPAATTFYISPVGGYCMVSELCPYNAVKSFIQPPTELPNLVNNGSLYYQCSGGSWYLNVCPVGYTFDPDNLNCSSTPSKYKNGNPLCTIGTRKSVQYNQQAYYECDGFSWVAKTCPQQLLFDPKMNSCNYTCPAGSKKQLIQDGVYNDGSFYLECNGSNWLLKKCPLRLIFNVYTSGCGQYKAPATKPTPKTTSSKP